MRDAIAYFEVKDGKRIEEGLLEHSVRTAAVGLVLYGRELGELREPFVLAALLHDVGKANRRSLKQYELVKKRNEGKVSFKCHEALSAQAVLKMKKYLGDAYEPVFYAVLRHHHAMRGLVEDCLNELDELELVLEDVGLLKDLVPPLGELKGLRPDKDLIVHEASQLENKGEAFILTGFLSLADSVAAYLKRRDDSSGKPSKFVRLALQERGWSEEGLREILKSKEEEVVRIVKKYF